MSNNGTVICPTCGLAVPAGVATCPDDDTPLDRGGLAPTMMLSPSGALDQLPPPPPSEEHPWPDPEPPSGVAHVDPMLGMQLGEYRIEALIGVGGMGLVYRGVQPVIGKPVAIKVLRPEISGNPSHMERLLVEARAVNACRHRGIIDIFSFGQLPDGRQYFVMEYMNGEALDEYIQARGPLPPSEAVGYLQEIASALHAAHVAGVVHRDLKPNNIFLVKQSGGRYVKLLDFGLAKQGVTLQPGATPQTQADLIMGTPEFIAPEQARGEAVGPRTDIYALGVVAFHMLTGQLPFAGKTPMDFVIAHLQTQPPKAIELMPDLPEALSELIDRMMKKAPEMRPESADQVRHVLKGIGRQLPQDITFVGAAPGAPQPRPATPPSVAAAPGPVAHPSGESTAQLPPRPVQRASQRLAAVWAGVGAFLVAAVVGASLVVFRFSSKPAPDVPPPPAVVEPVVPPPPPAPPEDVAPPPEESPSAAQAEPALADLSDSPPATPPASATVKPPRTRPPGRTRIATPTTPAASTTPPATASPLERERGKILQRIRELSRTLESRSNSVAGDPKKASALLTRAEGDARAAQDGAALATVERQLRAIEEIFFPKQ